MQLLGESNFEIYSRYFSQYGWYWYGIQIVILLC